MTDQRDAVSALLRAWGRGDPQAGEERRRITMGQDVPEHRRETSAVGGSS